MIYKEPKIGEKFYYQPAGKTVTYGGRSSYCTVAEMVTFEGYNNGRKSEAICRMLDGSRCVLRIEYLFETTGLVNQNKKRR